MSKSILGGPAMARLVSYDIWLYLFATVCPIFFLLPYHLHLAQRMFFVVGVIMLSSLTFFYQRQISYKNSLLGILFVYSIVVCLLHTHFKFVEGSYVNSFINFCILSEGLIYILAAGALFFIIICYKEKFDIRIPILIISVLNLIFCTTQLLGLELIWSNVPAQHNQMSVSGMMGSRSQLVLFSAASVPILWSLWRPASLIAIFNMIAGHSFTGVVALSIALFIFLFLNADWKKVVLILCVIPVLFVYVRWQKFTVRLDSWQYAWNEIVKSPLIGHGFDDSIYENKIMLEHNGVVQLTYRHNDYLNIARDMGVPFLLIILAFIFRALMETKLDHIWLALLVLVVGCFNQTNFYFPNIAVLGIFLIALKERERHERLSTAWYLR